MEQAQEFMHLPKILSKDDFYINEEVSDRKTVKMIELWVRTHQKSLGERNGNRSSKL